MTTTSVGKQAEAAAAKRLHKLGYKVLKTNWRTRWCEIDIIATKDGSIFFVEVKYRRSQEWGSGLEYITPTKLKQMKFAAEFWVSNNNYSGDYDLAAIEVSGNNLEVGELITGIAYA